MPEFTALYRGPLRNLWPVRWSRWPASRRWPADTTPGPDPNQAALILGNGGRTVFKAFLDGQNDADLDNDGVMDGVELWINMISSMFVCDNPADVPWLSELPTSGTTAAGARHPCR